MRVRGEIASLKGANQKDRERNEENELHEHIKDMVDRAQNLDAIVKDYQYDETSSHNWFYDLEDISMTKRRMDSSEEREKQEDLEYIRSKDTCPVAFEKEPKMDQLMKHLKGREREKMEQPFS